MVNSLRYHNLVLTSPSPELRHHGRFWDCFPCCLPRHHRVQVQTRRDSVSVAFKRGTTKVKIAAPQPGDVETAAPTVVNSADDLHGDDTKAEKALAAANKMTDTFSWEGLDYTVPVSGGAERKLLNNIFGYVVPRKLTALMGESGAGKVSPSLFINDTEPN